jgi:LuxR family maltose regulon positive regulatory protein
LRTVTTLEAPEPHTGDGGPTRRHRAGSGRVTSLDAFADPLKITRPRRRPGQVDRTGLVSRLTAAADCSLVLVAAPAGYGKSTSMALWVEADPRPTAWVSLDELDNDPLRFLRHLAVALDELEPLPDDLVQSLLRTNPAVDTVVVPRLGRALLSRRASFVLVVDDTHLVHHADTLECLLVVLDHLPPGSTMVLSGRSTPDLPIGRIRLQHQIVELGPDELAMSLEEARAMVEAAGVDLSPVAVRHLHDQTEGWPAGLALAAMAATEGQAANPLRAGFGGDHRLVAEYLHHELLSGLPDELALFLTRASVLPRLSGPLCDAVLQTTGSGQVLEDLARSKNLFVIPLDDTGGWYRFHHLFGDLLRAELHAEDPAGELTLHRRAGRLAEQEGDVDGAIRHAVAGGDVERAADIVLRSSISMSGRGRNATVGLWLELFDDHATRTLPQLGVAQALHQLAWGDADAVERWADVAEHAMHNGERDGRADDLVRLDLAIAVTRALVGRPGLEATSAHASVVIAAGPDANPWWGIANMLEGVARLMTGDPDAALGPLRESERSTVDEPQVQALAIVQQAHAELLLGRPDEAARLVVRAKQVARDNDLDDYLPIVAVSAVAALVEARTGDLSSARTDARRARRLLTAGQPIVVRTGVMVCALLARTELLLGDLVAARTIVDEGRSFAERDPAARLSIAELDAVDSELRRIESSEQLALATADLGPSSLTTAELRVLEYLPTHLSLKEIGERLYVSRNTVKSQAIATYRKLGVSSRGEAVTRARELGLVDS